MMDYKISSKTISQIILFPSSLYSVSTVVIQLLNEFPKQEIEIRR